MLCHNNKGPCPERQNDQLPDTIKYREALKRQLPLNIGGPLMSCVIRNLEPS